MTTATICRHCFGIVVRGDGHACEGVIAAKQREQARRYRKRVEHGRYTSHWRRLAHALIARDRECQDCGATEDLTAHLDPSFRGDHNAATIDDLTTLCRRCHGRRDGQRAHTRNGG